MSESSVYTTLNEWRETVTVWMSGEKQLQCEWVGRNSCIMNEWELDLGFLQPVPLSARGPLRTMHEKKKVTVWVSSSN